MKFKKQRIISIIAVVTMAIVLSCVFVACNKTDTPDAPKKEFTITFDTQGGSEVKPITIAEGTTITLPRNPTKKGFLFDGWYLSDAFVEKFVATKTITGDITLYAKWIEDNGQEEPPVAKTYSITFMVDGVTYKTFNISEGGVITLPENPEKKCCIFEGWYIDEDLLEKFNATQDISQDIVVYAKWSDNHTVVEDSEVPATCTTAGLTAGKHCSVCNEILKAQTEIPALGHDLETHAGKPATCTEKGWEAYDTCKRDGCTYTTYKEIPALNHDIEHHAGQPATCTEKGWEAYDTCKRDGCTYTTYQEIPALDHDLVHHDGKPATCTEKGWEAYDTCKRDGCTYTTYKEIPALGHDIEHHAGQPSTCTEKGWEAYDTCKRDDCTYTTYKEIPALDHDLEHHAGQPATCTEKGWEEYDTCKRDGCTYTTYKEIPALGHDLEHHAGKPATCTEKGWETYDTCKRDGCTYTTYKEIAALGHDLETHAGQPATCTEKGWEEYDTCKRDGCTYTTYKEIPALDHDLVYHEAKSPTCAEVGWEGYESCSRCDYSTYKEIPARHNFDENGTCVVCGYFETGLAFESNKDGESYSVVGIGTFDGTDLKIPNVNFDTKPVTGIKSNAFENCGSLTSVIIPDSVTSIGEGAFKGCSSLESMVIPFVGAKAGVTSSDTHQYPFGYIFGASNYDGSVATEQEYYDESTTTTFMETYYIPSSLTSVTVTGGNILHGAFYGCRGLTSITIPDSETTTSIGDFAFFECSDLQNVIIPGNITSIGEGAFGGCTKIINLIIHDNITSIGYAAFAYCTGLSNITVDENNPQFMSINNCIIDKKSREIILGCKTSVIPTDGSVISIGNAAFGGCTELINIIIPDNIINIGLAAFAECTGLKNITIPDGVQIGDLAFAECTGLTSITIPDSVAQFGSSVFEGCVSLTKITGRVDRVVAISNECGSKSFEIEITGNMNIEANAFAGRTELTGVTIGNDVERLETGAFQGCTNISKITGRADRVVAISNECGSKSFEIEITGNINVEANAFAGCTELTGVTIGNEVERLGTGAFQGCTNISKITGRADHVLAISKKCGSGAFEIEITGNRNIEASAFANRTEITGVTIGNEVTSIATKAFQNCSSLISVTIGNRVTTIGSLAFQNCLSLISVTIGKNVKSIDVGAFVNCHRLIEVYNKSSLNITAKSTSHGNVGYYAQNVYTAEGGSKLSTDENGYVIYTDGEEKILVSYFGTETELTLPSDITQIHNYAFYKCSGLTSITIPDSVTSIGGSAFSGCSNLTKIVGSSSWASVVAKQCGSESFEVVITGGTKIDDSAFQGCTGLTSIIIPDGLTTIGRLAFQGCTGLTSVTIPDSVTSIGNGAFQGCTGLTSITFNGTIAQWKSIPKEALWQNNVPGKCIVHCTDGDISI